MKNKQYQKRDYRNWVGSEDLLNFEVIEYETDLFISADKLLFDEALKSIKLYRKQLYEYIKVYPEFQKSFTPVNVKSGAPDIILTMAKSSKSAGVGPFATVAGAIAEFVGRDLLEYSSQVIVENGGDIFISSNKDRILGIYAGDSPLSKKLGLKIKKEQMPAGICTSSGTVGHSFSLGKADAVVIVSPSTALADAMATATANIIQTEKDINKAIEFAQTVENLTGVIAIKNKQIGVWGDVELVNI